MSDLMREQRKLMEEDEQTKVVAEDYDDVNELQEVFQNPAAAQVERPDTPQTAAGRSGRTRPYDCPGRRLRCSA